MPLTPEDIPDFIRGDDPLLRRVEVRHPDTHDPYGAVTYVSFEERCLGLPGNGLFAYDPVHHSHHYVDFEVADLETGRALRTCRGARHSPQSSF